MLRKKLTSTAIAGVAAFSTIITLAPAASAQSLDSLGRPTEPILMQLENLAEQPWIPETAASSIERAVGFLRGEGKPGVGIPQNGPPIQQFYYPMILDNCIGGTQTAVGTATAVAGPADLPLPGVPAQHAAFIFTALGTTAFAEEQIEPLTVTWINVANGRRGTSVLTENGLNPDGPITVNATADTGAGTLLLILQGGVTNNFEDDKVANCRLSAPVLGTMQVR